MPALSGTRLPSKLPREIRLHRVVAVLVMGVSIGLLSLQGALQLIDGPIYDLFMRCRAQMRPPPAQVLLIELDPSSSQHSPDNLVRLLEALDGIDACCIGVTFPTPSPDYDTFLETCGARNDVITSIPMLRPPGTSEFARSAELLRGSAGGVHPPPYEAGVHRRHYASFPMTRGSQASLEKVIAIHRGVSVADVDSYRVDFRGDAGSLPHSSAERALAGDLVEELVQDRVVLIGWQTRAEERGLFTPTTREQGMSPLEYHGHALNTLLTDRGIHEPAPWQQLLSQSLLLLLAYLLFRAFSVSLICWLTSAAVGVTLLGSLAAFVYLDTWCPPAPFLVSLTILFLSLLRSRIVDMTGAFRQLIDEAHRRLDEKSWSIHFDDSLRTWSLLAHMIDQTLDSQRLLFLQPTGNDKTLEEVVALRCSADDLPSDKCQYDHPPFTTCLTEGPIEVFDLLPAADEDEQQYLMPLTFSGELLGFWVIGINAYKAAAITRFESLLKQYSARVSELTYHARKRNEKGWIESLLGRPLLAEHTEETYQALSSALVMLGNQLETLQRVIDQLDSGLLVYDIFGRLLCANSRMLQHLAREKISPYNLTALDLLMAVGDFDLARAKQMLHKTVIGDATTTFPLEFPSQPNRRFAMQIKPLKQALGDGSTAADSAHTATVLELLDTTEVTHFNEMRTALTQRFFAQVREELATIDLSASLLSQLRLPAQDSHRMGELIHRRVHEAVASISECRRYLCTDTATEVMERFPVDPLPALQGAVEKARRQLDKDVTIKLWEPGTTRYTLAGSAELSFLFSSLLRVLVDDATEDSVILVRFSGDEHLVAIDFSNRGFGLPNEALQEYLHGDNPDINEEFLKVRKAAAWVEEWGGIFEAVSDVGVGIHFTIHLARFM